MSTEVDSWNPQKSEFFWNWFILLGNSGKNYTDFRKKYPYYCTYKLIRKSYRTLFEVAGINTFGDMSGLCVHFHLHVRIHIHIRVSVRVRARARDRVRGGVRISIHVHGDVHVHDDVCCHVHVYVHVSVYARVHVHVHLHIHIYAT